ncbi:DUF917 domain-containing protein [Natronincola ferrireducens]|uniref:Uncharacterized protein n=1 Tax=Natronincola ferrireducens TaxID=393762 RepID=A0A1G9HKP0_9FIRM|nr:DUF917 domain-containing protein [Natronincola ferrireducens]SDL13326.1 hypothetical protein SAMN05660472_02663 [Natronincola ferrireducens]
MRILSHQEVKDILVGCTILGTGGAVHWKQDLILLRKSLDLIYE